MCPTTNRKRISPVTAMITFLPINERAKPGGVGGALAGGAGGGGAGGRKGRVVRERGVILAGGAGRQAGDTTLLPGGVRWPSRFRFSVPPPSTWRAGASA